MIKSIQLNTHSFNRSNLNFGTSLFWLVWFTTPSENFSFFNLQKNKKINKLTNSTSAAPIKKKNTTYLFESLTISNLLAIKSRSETGSLHKGTFSIECWLEQLELLSSTVLEKLSSEGFVKKSKSMYFFCWVVQTNVVPGVVKSHVSV